MLTQAEIRGIAGLPVDGSDEEVAGIVAERMECQQPKEPQTIAWINRVLDNCRGLPDDPGPLDRAIALMHVTDPSVQQPDMGQKLEALAADLGLERDAKGRISTFVDEDILPALVANGFVFLHGKDEEDFASALTGPEREAAWERVRAHRL